MIDQIVILRKTLSTNAKPRLTMSYSKGNNNLICHLLNYMLFNLLYWMFHFLVCNDVFFYYFNVSFDIQSTFIHFYWCSVILQGSIWEGDSKKCVNRWAMCQSRMLPSSYPIKSQLTYMKYNNMTWSTFTAYLCHT